MYEISSLRVNIIKWQVKFNPVAYGLNCLILKKPLRCFGTPRTARQITQRNTPEESHLHLHAYEKFKSGI